MSLNRNVGIERGTWGHFRNSEWDKSSICHVEPQLLTFEHIQIGQGGVCNRGGGESHCFLILKIIILSNLTNTFFRSDSQMNTIRWCILWIGITGALTIVTQIRKEARMLAPARELQHYLLSEGKTIRRGVLKEKQRPPQATSTPPFSYILRSHL